MRMSLRTAVSMAKVIPTAESLTSVKLTPRYITLLNSETVKISRCPIPESYKTRFVPLRQHQCFIRSLSSSILILLAPHLVNIELATKIRLSSPWLNASSPSPRRSGAALLAAACIPLRSSLMLKFLLLLSRLLLLFTDILLYGTAAAHRYRFSAVVDCYGRKPPTPSPCP